MRWATVLLLHAVACGSNGPQDTPAPDAPEDRSVQLRITMRDHEPLDRPAPSVKPVKVIDGEVRDTLELTYPDWSEAEGTRHVVELRVGDLVIAREEVIVERECPNVELVSYHSFGFCAFDSGDIRPSSVSQAGTGGGCIGDAFCSTCMGNCGEQRCTSRITSVDPLFSHLACAPAGPRALGESCALIPDAAGAYDDCGADLLCVEGRCREACIPRQFPTSCAGCSYVPGHAPEIGVCPDPMAR